MAQCHSCGKTAKQTTKSVTGRDLCPKCKRKLDGAAVYMAVTGHTGADPVPEAIATVGWLERIRKARKKK